MLICLRRSHVFLCCAASTLLLLLVLQCQTYGQLIFEDFLDGDISDDSGLNWTFTGEHSVSESGLLLTSEAALPATASAFDTDIRTRPWSIRMQVRLQDSGTFGLKATRPESEANVMLNSAGTLSAEFPGHSLETDLEPTAEDVILQVDFLVAFHSGIRIQAWREMQDPPDIAVAALVGGNDPTINIAADNDQFSAELRWLAFMPSDRMPVHIPISLLRLDCSYDEHYTSEFGSFDDERLAVDQILTVVDIECATESTIQPLLDQIGILAGDANLDGQVDFSDFLSLSTNFGSVGGWEKGDFNASGKIDFADFLLLSSNFGDQTQTSAVPEPTGVVMYWPGLFFVLFGIRRPR